MLWPIFSISSFCWIKVPLHSMLIDRTLKWFNTYKENMLVRQDMNVYVYIYNIYCVFYFWLGILVLLYLCVIALHCYSKAILEWQTHSAMRQLYLDYRMSPSLAIDPGKSRIGIKNKINDRQNKPMEKENPLRDKWMRIRMRIYLIYGRYN